MAAERHFTEAFVARLAAREKQIQQHFRPVISVHKWFARRPGSLFRSLALAELVDRPVSSSFTEAHHLTGVCLDPFMGGGIPLLEAARLGLSVVGYDTNPMSRWLVERELEALDPEALATAGDRVAAKVERRVGDLYRTTCPDCRGDAQARYFLWVRHRRCVCGQERPLLADTLLVSTGLGRHPREVHLCGSCLTVSQHRPGRRSRRCPGCDASFDAALVAPDTLHVCGCGEAYRIPPQGTIEHPYQRLAVVDYHCGACHEPAQRAYKTADARDHELLAVAERRSRRYGNSWPTELIPHGIETDRLLRWGYLQWRDLFGPRQRYGLAMLAAAIDREPEAGLRRALYTVFSDGLRYQNALVRYDRQALKPTDVFAMHSFAVPRVSCEVALLGQTGTGSGGFRHVLAKYVRAKRWCAAPYETVPDARGRLRRYPVVPESLSAAVVAAPSDLGDSGRAFLQRASLGAGDLPDESVDLVLTDPPYFANVQYAELMDFCYAWLRQLAPSTPFFDVPHTKTAEDAVGSVGTVGLAEFTTRLSEVFVSAGRALKQGGLFAFTYHHNALDAYAPLVVACLDAGLVPTRLAACPSEMRASTHILGRNAATIDAVFILRKPPVPDAIAADFAMLDPARAASARAAVMRRAGVRVTAADRQCLRYAAQALQAMSRLADGWDRVSPADRLPLTLSTLGVESQVSDLLVGVE